MSEHVTSRNRRCTSSPCAKSGWTPGPARGRAKPRAACGSRPPIPDPRSHPGTCVPGSLFTQYSVLITHHSSLLHPRPPIPDPRSPTSDRRGAALLLVLWAVAVLSLLAGGLTFALRQDLAITNLQKERLTAHVLARAGIERSIAAVMDHDLPTFNLDDLWCDDPQYFQEVPLSGGTFSVMHGSQDSQPTVWYGAQDESSKLNLNVATREQLLELPEMTESIAAAIIDWRDADDDPEPEGAEGSHYAALPHPYVIRNGPLRTVRELLCVRGVTPELLYGEDTNANGLLDPNEDDGTASPPMDNGDGRLDRGWFAWVTVYSYERNVSGSGAKRLNIASAQAGEIASQLSLEDWAAQSIVKARDNRKFEHLIDLLDVQRDTSGERTREEDDINARSGNEKDQPVTQSIFKRIVDGITLQDEKMLPGRINLNTAPQEVLVTLPEVDDELAGAIVRHRGSGSGYTSIGSLLDVTGMTKEKFAKLESSVTVRSSVFRIRSQGRSDSGLASATIECVVDRGGNVPRVLYTLESMP